jgi:hypothetical protein
MSDELDVELEQEGGQEQERDWEAEAKSMGWNPEHEGDDKLDAKEFVGRQPLYKQLKKERRRIRDLETAITQQQQNFNSLLEKQREKIIQDLTAKRDAAVEAGDVRAAFDLDSKIRDEAQKPTPAQTVKPPPEYDAFVERNDWYKEDEDMTLFADTFGNKYRASHPNVTPEELFAAVENKVRSAFPHKFENPNRRKAVSVESGEGKTVSQVAKTPKMPKEHKTVCEAMWRRGAWGDVSLKEAMDKYTSDYVNKFGGFE